ncbi:MAG: GNAT family N-acetyltransferase, partial [Eubacterium sp.]|nr:GNAT family N-acetyltransferase [Eubacterium sp.]
MIKQIEEISQFNGYDLTDIYAVRILSLLNAYSCKYPFARFYRQINDDGAVTAILSVLDKDITISFDKNADRDELSQFVSVIGFDSVLCDEALEIDSCYECGIVMKTDKSIEIPCNYMEIDEYPHLFDLYNFIDYGEINFDSWYVDISHRIRHGAAKAFTLNMDEEIISSAIFSSIYKNNAILTGVQTKPEFRKMGYGSALISAMCCDFNGTVYLMRENGRNESFYKKLGFENIG